MRKPELLCYDPAHGLSLHWFRPARETPGPAIVFLFGGGWRHGSVRHFYQQADYFAGRGYACFCVEYRVLADHPEATPELCLADVTAAMEYLADNAARLGIRPERIVLGGGSAGGHLALCYALRGGRVRPAALLLYNPIVDTTETGYAHGTPLFRGRARELSPVHLVRGRLPDLFAAQGECDRAAAPDCLRRFLRVCEGYGTRIDARFYPGQEHGFFNHPEFRPASTLEMYRRVLADSEAFLETLGLFCEESDKKERAGMDTLERFKLHLDGRAFPDNIVRFGGARFTVITPSLIRMEYSREGRFEDRPTQTFFHRDLGAVEFTRRERDGALTLETGALVLEYRETPIGFDRNTLSVLVKATGKRWHYSYFDRENLKGTARTLDGGRGPIPLEEGLMSRLGFFCVNDTGRLPLGEDGFPVARETDGCQDLYLFGYGTEYQRCLKDYFRLTGEMPLLPRFAFGNWWSRFAEYSQDDLKELVGEFEAHGIPLAVCIVDMDWHIVENPYHLGWTGYTFNPKLFPDHREFFRWLHEKGLRTSLNLHPSEGVAPHEAMYGEFCRAVGADPGDKGIIPFNITDRDYIRAYFDVLHHPYEADGVDFWWIDWQQGSKTAVEGLDPLWMLNHLHYLDAGRDPDKRPFFFSRWCGLGGHRYQIGFSGDAMVTWEMLDFEPYFTATSANVGNFFWSHDIGGHYSGFHDPELYVRWVQFGVFSPILRLHSCKNPLQERRPWKYEPKDCADLTAALTLRHRLIPYLYTMAWRAHTEAQPLLAPMYYQNPDEDAAYSCANQYWFGDQLIAAPVTRPADPELHTARKSVWLPEGDFYDFFTGEHYTGGRHVAVYAEQGEIPVFAKSGAIVPLDGAPAATGTPNPSVLELCFFPGTGEFELYEDDGSSQQFQNGACVHTKITSDYRDAGCRAAIAPRGDFAVLPARRDYRLVFRSIAEPVRTACRAGGREIAAEQEYDAAERCLTLRLAGVSAGEPVEAEIATRGGANARRDRSAARLERQMRRWRAANDPVWAALSHLEEIQAEPARLLILAPGMAEKQKDCVLETLLKTDLKSIPPQGGVR